MSKVLIVGTITKDVYLRLDERQNKFEVDEAGVAWMDLAFNGSSHRFFRRLSVFGGAVVALEVFSKFGVEAKISGENVNLVDGSVIVPPEVMADYRYILSKGNKIVYFTASERATTKFVAPSEAVDYIYVSRSANLTQELCEQISQYLALATGTKLAVFLSHKVDTGKDWARELVEQAEVVITNLPDVEGDYHIEPNFIKSGEQILEWTAGDKGGLRTHLTTDSIIATSILSGRILGMSVPEQLLLAKYNVEGSTLEMTVSFDKLKEEIMGQEWQVKRAGTTVNGGGEAQTNSDSELREMVARLLGNGKGILAADESGGSIHKKFESMGIVDDEQHRRDYRNIFFTTPDLEKYVNGVILFDETARQLADDGETFVRFLTGRGVVPGIKVDQGLEKFEGSEETWTKGLEGLPERLTDYYMLGLRFAKWRAAFEIRENTPSEMAVNKNCEILAKYARDCQAAGIVPIVEPEVVYDGNYGIERCAEVTGWILRVLVEKLRERDVDLFACIVKCNMVLAGKQFETQSTPEEVGRATADVLRSSIPEDLAGVVFLSGGQSVEQATANMQAVSNEQPFPWPVTFSFARALQDPALEVWRGDNANADAAREAFRLRLVANCGALIKKS